MVGSKESRYASLLVDVRSAAAVAVGEKRDALNQLLGEVMVYAEYANLFKVSHLESLEARARDLL